MLLDPVELAPSVSFFNTSGQHWELPHLQCRRPECHGAEYSGIPHWFCLESN